jgi:hypothetical protein
MGRIRTGMKYKIPVIMQDHPVSINHMTKELFASMKVEP